MSRRQRTEAEAASRRVVLALCTSAVAEWGGASAVLPLLPVYLHREGSSIALVGLTMAAFFAAAVLVQYPLGRLSDRIGRRSIQIGGLAAYAIGSILFALVAAPVAALLFRALQGAGAGIVDVANAATIGDVVPESHRGRAYGALWGSRTAGMAIGPLFGGIVGFGGMRYLFLAAAAAVLAAAVPIFYFTPRSAPRPARGPQALTALWRNRSVLAVATAFLAGGVVVGVYEVCWSLLLTSRGAKAWQVGLSWTLFAIPFAVMSLPAGWLVDHLDRRRLIAVSLVGSAAFALAYPFIHSVAWLVGLGAAEAVMVSLGAPAESAQLANSVSNHELGRAQGAVATAQTAAMAIAASTAGAMFASAAWIPFVGAGLLIIVLTAVMGIFFRGVPGRGSLARNRGEVTELAVVLAPAETPLGLSEPVGSAEGA